jgi:sterol desaturase/sphingolipid hydroxylase (fatty acid hydroxylase superfamily)
MNLADIAGQKLEQIAAPLIAPGSFFSLPQLFIAFVIASLWLALLRKRRGRVVRPSVMLRALSARRVVFSRSTYADLFYFLVNSFATTGLIGWGIISGLAVSGWSVRALHAAFGEVAPASMPDWVLRGGITVIAFLGYEIGYYIDHYLKHRIPFLWEFHKTHHTAEVLTPFTVFRVHPIDSLIYTDIVAICVGVLHGAFIYLSGKGVSFYAIDGANVVMVVFYFLLAHLQHSQFWIPFTGLYGRILLSPAHHQIHHSADPSHYNRNLGSFLAIWDWMFGTLVVPRRSSPRLKFGAAQSGADPHRITALLIDPITNAVALLGIRPLRAAQRGRAAIAVDATLIPRR